MDSRWSRVAMVAALVGIFAACGVDRQVPGAPEVSAAQPQNPLGRATWQEQTLRGAVREVLRVDHYCYLKLTDSHQAERWVVVINEQHQVGEEVEARVFAHLDGFRSHKLGRAFSRLHFGVIDGPARLTRLPRVQIIGDRS